MVFPLTSINTNLPIFRAYQKKMFFESSFWRMGRYSISKFSKNIRPNLWIFLIGLIKIYLIGLFSKIEKKFYIYHSTIQQSNKDCIWTTEDSMCTSGKLNKTEVNSSTKTFKKLITKPLKQYSVLQPSPMVLPAPFPLSPADPLA